MTLIVYSGDKIYADDCEVQRGEDRRRRIVKEKIFINPRNTVAVAIFGPFPQSSFLPYVASQMAVVMFHVETNSGDAIKATFGADKFDEKIKQLKLEKGSPTSYLIGTKNSLALLDHTGLVLCNKSFEYSYASGSVNFAVCRKAGLTIEQSYEHVSSFNRTVGKLNQVVDLTKLNDTVTTITDRMTDPSVQELKLKLIMANKSYLENCP